MIFFFQAEDGIRDLVRSRGLGDVYKRQGTPHQYFVIPPSRAKSVEVGRSHTHLHQISAGVTVHRNRSGGRDEVRSDRVPKDGQRTRPFDVLQLSSFLWKILEEWRVLNVGGLPVPLIERPTRGLYLLPG